MPAATLVLLRDAAATPADIEVLLLRRPEGAAFAPGAHVFPGGIVDPADSSADALLLVRGVTPAVAAGRLGLDDPLDAIAYYVAAIRETFEETGLLLGGGNLADLPPERREHAREQVLSGERSFAAVAASHGWLLGAGKLEYIAHWITPVDRPRRYDTRFFMAVAPDGASPTPDHRESVELLWITPSEALRRARHGSLRLVAPTARTLEELSVHRSVGDAFGALAGRPVHAILPESAREGNALPPRPSGAN